MTPIDTLIEELTKLEAGATPGEWSVKDFSRDSDEIQIRSADEVLAKIVYNLTEQDHANAALIAAARNALPALLLALIEAREALRFAIDVERHRYGGLAENSAIAERARAALGEGE